MPFSVIDADGAFERIPTQIQMPQLREFCDLPRHGSREVVLRKPQGRDVPLGVGLHAVPLAQRLVAAPVLAVRPAAAFGRVVECPQRRALRVRIVPRGLHDGQFVEQVGRLILEHDKPRAFPCIRIGRDREAVCTLFEPRCGPRFGELLDPLAALFHRYGVVYVRLHLYRECPLFTADFKPVVARDDRVLLRLRDLDALFEGFATQDKCKAPPDILLIRVHLHRNINLPARITRRGSDVVPSSGIDGRFRSGLRGNTPRLIGRENQYGAPALRTERRGG